MKQVIAAAVSILLLSLALPLAAEEAAPGNRHAGEQKTVQKEGRGKKALLSLREREEKRRAAKKRAAEMRRQQQQ